MPTRGSMHVPASREQIESLVNHGVCVLAEELGNHTIRHLDVGYEFFLTIGETLYPVRVVGKQLKSLDKSSGSAFIIATRGIVRL